jgi:hypothetical protein
MGDTTAASEQHAENETKCEVCGKILVIGEWPLCGGRNSHGFPIKGLTVVGDEIDEVIENMAPEPIHFTSRAEKRRYMKEHGIREKVRHVGEQGSDKSRFTSRWV